VLIVVRLPLSAPKNDIRQVHLYIILYYIIPLPLDCFRSKEELINTFKVSTSDGDKQIKKYIVPKG